MRVRAYVPRDAAAIATLFYETIHSINAAHYSVEQVNAWAPGILAPSAWEIRLAGMHVFVGEDTAGSVAGFGTLENCDHLDHLYCRKDLVGSGMGKLIYGALEERAKELRSTRLFTEASITARPFFERRGMHVIREQTVSVRGVEMINYVMEKDLG